MGDQRGSEPAKTGVPEGRSRSSLRGRSTRSDNLQIQEKRGGGEGGEEKNGRNNSEPAEFTLLHLCKGGGETLATSVSEHVPPKSKPPLGGEGATWLRN